MIVHRATILWLLLQLELHGQWVMPDANGGTLLTVTQTTIDHSLAWSLDWGNDGVPRSPSLIDALMQAPDAILAELATYPKAG